jgi:hypothetical protein
MTKFWNQHLSVPLVYAVNTKEKYDKITEAFARYISVLEVVELHKFSVDPGKLRETPCIIQCEHKVWKKDHNRVM